MKKLNIFIILTLISKILLGQNSPNNILIKQLDSIFYDDQKYRILIEEKQKEFGLESKEMNSLWKAIDEVDSINTIKIKKVLDKYGWPGSDIIGEHGCLAIWSVIQHSDLLTQEKYLPIMREAVKNGKALGRNLALLEDKIALKQGRKQIYGSQIGLDYETGLYVVEELEDPENVDLRRAKMGLNSMSEYTSQWQINWSVEQYKKDWEYIEARRTARNKH